MKLSDYVVDYLSKNGVAHVFGLTGGAAAHMFDSVDRHPSVTPVFNHHEQAAAFAAEAYAKANNQFGACFCTTGPGATNIVTGLAAAWLDSIPCIYVSGQTRIAHTTQGKPIRQLGTQQLDVLPIVQSLTKYAVMVEDPKRIKFHLEKAVHLAKTGRPGPVWLDIPLDFQWANIEPDQLEGFAPEASQQELPKDTDKKIEECYELLKKAKRPLVLAGYGVSLADARQEFKKFVEELRVPFVTTWGAADVMPTDVPMNIGRPGMSGQRGANLAVQNCDLLISVGSHLCIPVTGTNYDAFAREAKLVVVDIDQNELDHETVKVDLPIRCDAKYFLNKLQGMITSKAYDHPDLSFWLGKCEKYRHYNRIPAKKEGSTTVDQYLFVDTLSDQLTPSDAIVVDGGGTNVYIAYQALKLKEGQRLILSTGLCSMGSGLPESVGVCFARNKGRVICLCGDGSLQLNIQELQTIVHHNLPIKIFVFNNDGYVSIRQTQAGFLDSNFVGSDKKGGMSLPNYVSIAKAYGIKALRIDDVAQMRSGISEILAMEGPALCEVVVSREQQIAPAQGFDRNANGSFSARPLEDMAPYLDRSEFSDLMIVKPWSN